MKPLLAILLTVTQLASCGAAPIWLCIARDGAISLALGPDDCNCPEHARLRNVEGALPLLPLAPGTRPTRVGRHSVDSCGCLHLELAHEPAPTVERASVTERLAEMILISAETPLFVNLADAACHFQSPGAAEIAAPPLRAELGAMLSSVVLRL